MSDFGDFITTGDHTRGCAGREYACTCGYDDAKDAEILRLRAELAALREPAGDLVEVAASIMAGAHPGMPWDKIARAVLDAVLPRVRAEVLESLRPVSHWSVDWPPEEGEDSPPPDAAS